MLRPVAMMLFLFLPATLCFGQNVFNPADTVYRWDVAKPYGSRENPRSSVEGLQKWVTVETNGISTGWGSFDAYSFKPYFLRLAGKSVAFRLKFPRSYLNGDSAGKKYPIMLFFHGAGEPACISNGGIYNNEKHLLHGASTFRQLVDDNSFDGFLLFPQIYTTNTGCWASTWNTTHYFPLIVSIIDSLAKYARGDIDRVIANGLSSGGVAAWKFAELYPQRVAGIAPTSSVGGTGTNYDKFVHVPVWLATGSIDYNPSLSTAQAAINAIRTRGGNAKHTVYPDQGHFVWNFHWNEPGFPDFMSAAHKANPLVFFDRSSFCPDSAILARLGVTPGFHSYEWQWNAQTIATTFNGIHTIVDSSTVSSNQGNEIVVKKTGSYRVRFRRQQNSEWSAWSTRPATIRLKTITQTPAITVSGLQSMALPAPDGSTTVELELPEGYANYQWYRVPDTTIVSTSRKLTTGPGDYIARYSELNGCGSEFSPVIHVISAQTEIPPPDYSLKARPISFSGLSLSWNAVPSAQKWEVYRSKNPAEGFKLIAILHGDSLNYSDNNLSDGSLFFYRVRALADTSSFPASETVSARTRVDTIPPTMPTGVEFAGGSSSSIFIRWKRSHDNDTVVRYEIYLNDQNLFSSPDTSFMVGGLDSLQFYRLQVVALDRSGNSSVKSQTVMGYTHRKGLQFSYYHGNWNQLPDFSSISPVKSGVMDTISVNNAIRLQNDYFAFKWSGFIFIPANDIYTFEIQSDDGSRLYIDSLYGAAVTPLVNNDGMHGIQGRSGSKFLTRGYHPVTITYFEKTGGEFIRLLWSRQKGHTLQPIPSTYFTIDSTGIPIYIDNSDSVAPARPGKPRYRGSDTGSIQLAWDPVPNEDLSRYLVYVNGEPRDSTSETSIVIERLVPHTLYTILIRAVDAAGNVSEPSPQISAFTHSPGLLYKNFQGNWNMLPDFDQLQPENSGITDTLSINGAPWTDAFAYLWEGWIFIPESGIYRFETNSDDGSKLYIDTSYSFGASALVENDGLHGAQLRSGETNLDRGYHRIAISFFENYGSEIMEVFWSSGNGLTRERIPRKFFTFSNTVLPHPPAKPDSLLLLAVSHKIVSISWEDTTSTASAYELYRSENGSAFELIASVVADSTHFEDHFVKPQTRYQYRLRSVGATGESGFLQDSIITPMAPTFLATPSSVEANTFGTDLIVISWDYQTSSENGFRLYRAGPVDSAGFSLQKIIPAETNAVVDSVPQRGRYFYYLEAFNDTASSQSSIVSAFSGNVDPVISMTGSNQFIKSDTTLLLSVTLSDSPDDSLSVSIAGVPFGSVENTGFRKYRIRLSPATGDVGEYKLNVIANDDKGGTSSRQIGVFVGDSRTKTVKIDFGHASIPSPRPWNNWPGLIQANATISNLRDDKNQLTPYTLKMLHSWQSLTSLGMKTGNDSGAFPDTVLGRGLRDPNVTRQLLLTGLDRNKKYNLIFPSSVNDGTVAKNSFSAAGKKDTLDIRYNTRQACSLNYLSPDSLGQILITFQRLPGTPYIYLNAMLIEEYEASMHLLSPYALRAELDNNRHIQLTWIDRSGTENESDGFEVQRSENPGFDSAIVVFTVPGNTTSFTDTQTMPGKYYWYRVRTKSGTGFSAPGNTTGIHVPTEIIFVNLNHNVPPAAAPWNNLGSAPTYKFYSSYLLNESKSLTGKFVEVKKTFNGENNAGMNTGNNFGVAPDNVLRANYWVDKLQKAAIRINGLDRSKTYSVGFIGSIGPNGWIANNYTSTYSIGSKTVYLNAWQNTNKFVYLHDLVPDANGGLDAEFSTTQEAAYGFTAGLVIFEYDDRQPVVSPARIQTNQIDTLITAAPTRAVSSLQSTHIPYKGTNGDMARIYPNPFLSELKVELNGNLSGKNIEVRLSGIAGNVILTKNFEGIAGPVVLNIKVPFLNNGVYVLTVLVDRRLIKAEKLIRKG